MKQFLSRMQGILPEGEVPSFIEALERLQAKPRKSLRLNRLAKDWTREKLEAFGIRLEGQVPWCEQGYFYDVSSLDRPATHPLIAAGVFFIQEAGAMEPVQALDVRPGMQVLDLCAAPGAKSTQIGECLEGKGWLVSNDPHRERAKVLDVLLSRHGISNSTVHNLEPRGLSEIYSSFFDRILVDAPCSGESLFAKRKEKRFDISKREVERCSLRQLNILNEAFRMLAPGGRIVYSTCTYAREENEEVVHAFLAKYPEMKLVSESRRWPHRDLVPGGYFAVLENAPAMTPVAIRERPEPKTHGLIRNGLLRWNGESDRYARAMDRFSKGDAAHSVDFRKMDADRLRRFLSGDVSDLAGNAKEPGDYAIRFDGESVGAVSFDGRNWKSLLPPQLRSTGR